MYVLKIMQVFEIGLVIEIKIVLNWESKKLDIYTYMNKSALDMIYNFDLNLDKGYIDYILLRIFWVTSIRTR